MEGNETINIESLKLAQQIERLVQQIVERQALRASVLTPQPHREWMTIMELAEYWRFFDKEGNPVTAGILKWMRRPKDEHPLPHGYMGDKPRFKREAVDRWAEEESEIRRKESERKRLELAS
jgi:hypothetical protein